MLSQNKIKSTCLWGLLFLFIGCGEIVLGIMVTIHPAIPILLLFPLFIIIIALINPDIGIAALIFTVPFSVGSFNKDLTRLNSLDTVHVMLLCLIFLNLITLRTRPRLRLSSSPIDLILFLFIGWAAITVLWSPSTIVALIHLLFLVLSYLLFYVAYISIHNLKSLEKAIWGWWLVGVVFFLVGMMQYAGVVQMEVKSTTMEGYSRVIGFKGSPSAFAGIMMLTFFTMLGAYQYFETMNKKSLVGICAVLSLIIVLLTLSRSAFVGLFAGILFYFIKYIKGNFVRYFIIFVSIIIALLVFGSLANINLADRITTIFAFYKEPSWIIRLAIWATSIEMFLNSYGLGVGAGGFEILFERYFEKPYEFIEVPPHPHSLYFDVLTHFGILGFTLFVILIIKIAHYLNGSLKTIKNAKHRKLLWAFCSALVALSVQSILTGLFHNTVIWVFVGMTLACSKAFTRDQSN